MKPNIEVPAIPRSALEKLLDAASVAVLLAAVVYLAVQWPSLPEQVPLHFNGRGEPDRWGTKITILFLPCIALFLFGFMSILRKLPSAFNVPVAVTPDNAEAVYRLSFQLLAWIKLEVVLLLCVILTGAVRSAQGSSDGLGLWLLPVVLSVFAVTIVVYTIRVRKLGRSRP